MSRIERRDFSSELMRIDTTRIPPRVLATLEQAGLAPADLQRIADGDHVISGAAEFERLYDRLAELDRRDASAGRPDAGARLDRAGAVYAALVEAATASGAPTTARTEAPARPTVGVGRAGRRDFSGDAGEPGGPPARADARADARSGAPAAVASGAAPNAAQPGAAPQTAQHEAAPTPNTPEERRAQRDAIVARLTALPTPPPARGEARLPSVSSFLEAIDAYEARHASGAPRGGGRPVGVSQDQWAMSAALQRQGISADDVRSYLATGQLPDRLAADGTVAETGTQRMERLQRSATQVGEWTAVNSLTFLTQMQRSSLRAERAELLRSAGALDAADPRRASLTEEAQGLHTLEQGIGQDQQRVYRQATQARERIARSEVGRATDLESRADRLRERDPVRAAELDARAQRMRDRGVVRANAEAEYRASVPGAGFSAARTFQVAATGQIDAARRVIDRTAASVAIPPAALAGLSTDPAARMPNGVAGAGALLARARADDPTMARDQTQLALEGRREDTVARFHDGALTRGEYRAAVREGRDVPDALVAHRRAYLEARVRQLDVADQRLALYGPPATVPREDALAAARVAGERQGITTELFQDLGSAAEARLVASDARARVGTLARTRDLASQEEGRAQTSRDATSADRSRTVDAADAILGDGAKFADEAERDRQSVRDADRMLAGDDATLRFTQARATDAQAQLDAARTAETTAARRADTTGADAELVRAALPTALRGTDLATAYAATRGAADRQLTNRGAYLDRAEAVLPRDATVRDAARRELAVARLDLAQAQARSVDVRVRAEGDPGRADATTRLTAAEAQVGRADALGTAFTDPAQRSSFARASVDIRSGVAEGWSEYDPSRARTQLETAERVALRDTVGADRAAALDRVGLGAASSVVRADLRFREIHRAGPADLRAPDALYAQGRRLLGDRNAAGPWSPTAAEGRRLLEQVDTALDAVPRMLRAAGSQVQAGTDVAAAQSRAIGRAEGRVAQAPVSVVISGPTYWATRGFGAIFGTGVVDMRGDIARTADDSTRMTVDRGSAAPGRTVRGAEELALGFERARGNGHGLEFLGALRIAGDRELSARPGTYTSARSTLMVLNPASAAPDANYGDFIDHAMRGQRRTEGPADVRQAYIGVPVAQALGGPLLSYTAAERALGQRDLPVVLAPAADMVAETQASYERERDNVGYMGEAVLGLEVALGVVLTAGIGSEAALARGGVGAVEAASTLATIGRAAGHTLAVGGVMMGMSYGVRQLVGANTSAAHTFDTLTNFIPIGAGQRAANLSRAVAGAETGAARAAAFSQRMLRAATPAGLAFAQGFVGAAGTRVLSERFRIQSELGQMALGLGINTLLSGGLAGATSVVSRGRSTEAFARRLTESVHGEANAETVRRVQAEVRSFLSQTGERVPTEAELGALRSRLYESLGVDPAATGGDHVERRQIIDGFTEGLRLERAATHGLRDAGLERRALSSLTEAELGRAVEATRDTLMTSRGPTASSAEATAHASRMFAQQLRAEAQGAREPAQRATLERSARALEARALSAELAEAMTVPAERSSATLLTPAEAPRVEAVLREALRAPTGPLGDTAARPEFTAELAGRLQRDGGLPADRARTVAEATRGALVAQGIITPEATLRLATPQVQRAVATHPEAAVFLHALGEPRFRAAFMDEGGALLLGASELMRLPEPRRSEVATHAARDPAGVRTLLDARFGSNSSLVRQALETQGVEAGIALARIAERSPLGLELMRSEAGSDAALLAQRARDPAAFATEAAAQQARIYVRARDGVFLMRGDPPAAARPATAPELRALAERAGIPPARLPGPASTPAEIARAVEQIRRELPADARAALDRELAGRRFVDQADFEPTRAAGVDTPEYRYGRQDFQAWQRAASRVDAAVRAGEPMTVELLRELHGLASEGVVADSNRGRLRSGPSDQAVQGGDGPLNIQTMTAEQFEALRANPDLEVIEVGREPGGSVLAAVSYLRPAAVEGRVRQVLAEMETRLQRGDDPLQVAADTQRALVSIHPFMDGNGRTTRLVMDYVLQRAGLEPSIVADPMRDLHGTPESWRADVRAGQQRPLQVALEHYTRAMDAARADVQRTIDGGGPGSDALRAVMAERGPLEAQRVRDFLASDPRVSAYLDRWVGDAGERADIARLLTRLSGEPRASGVGDWVSFSMAPHGGADVAAVRQRLVERVAELRIADGVLAQDPAARVALGNDASPVRYLDGAGRPTNDAAPSFDLRVTRRDGTAANVEVFAPADAAPAAGNFGEAITHAADKILTGPRIRPQDRTTGPIEAAVMVRIPSTPEPARGRQAMQIARDGSMTLVNAPRDPSAPLVRVDRGNLFTDYLAILNGDPRARGRAPEAAARVDALHVFDTNGREVYRFDRNRETGRWTGTVVPE